MENAIGLSDRSVLGAEGPNVALHIVVLHLISQYYNTVMMDTLRIHQRTHFVP